MDVEQHVAAHVRTLLGAGVAAALVLAVVAVFVSPTISGDDPPEAADHPAPASCLPEAALDHQDFRSGTAAWVLSCPRVGRLPSLDALLPAGTLTTGAASLVRGWQRKAVPTGGLLAFCGGGGGPDATVQVGFADGTVSQVDIGCVGEVTPRLEQITMFGNELMDQLATAFAQQNDARYQAAAVPGARPRCPVTMHGPGAMDVDGASATRLDDSGALLDLTAASGLVCRYERGRLAAAVGHLAPQSLLLAAGSGWVSKDVSSRLDLSHTRAVRQGLSSYLVALSDKTGTRRAFTITGHYGVLTLYHGDGTTDVPGYVGGPMLVALGLMRG